MAILSFLINEAVLLYKRAAKLKASAVLENEKDDLKESVSISTESKRNQVIEQTKTEVLQKIRNTE